MERSVPFKIQKGVGVSMSKQMTNGLREAIASGYYKPGVVLPTILEWSKLLGVSIRVPEAAVAALVREGLITAQKRTGCVVNVRRQDVWVGRVLVIVPDGDHVYYQNVLDAAVLDWAETAWACACHGAECANKGVWRRHHSAADMPVWRLNALRRA